MMRCCCVVLVLAALVLVSGCVPEGRYAGDGGPAVKASLNLPAGVAVAADGSLYIADFGNLRIRKVNPEGIIITYAGNGRAGFLGGEAIRSCLNGPISVAWGQDGSLYIADSQNNRVRKVDPTGTLVTVVGDGRPRYTGDGGPATKACLNNPNSVAIGPDGSIYIADSGNHRIRKIDPAGVISTVAGDGWTSKDESDEGRYAGDGGSAVKASFNKPIGLALAPDGSMYIADFDNHRIRKVAPTGIITTVAGNGWVDQEGKSRYAGNGGPATKASLFCPAGVAVGMDGSLFIADLFNQRIRKVNPAGIITTVAGDGWTREQKIEGWVE